jgi:hypothetical protein
MVSPQLKLPVAPKLTNQNRQTYDTIGSHKVTPSSFGSPATSLTPAQAAALNGVIGAPFRRPVSMSMAQRTQKALTAATAGPAHLTAGEHQVQADQLAKNAQTLANAAQ